MGDAGGGAPQPTAEAALAVLRLLDTTPIAQGLKAFMRKRGGGGGGDGGRDEGRKR